MLTLDKTYSGEIVLDLMSRNRFLEILKFKKLSLVIKSVWEGRYETHGFLNYSLNYQIINTILMKQVGFWGDFRTC